MLGGRGRHVGTTTTKEHKSELRWSVNGDFMCVCAHACTIEEKVEEVGSGQIYAKKGAFRRIHIEEYSGGKVLVFRSGCIPKQKLNSELHRCQVCL